MPNQRFTVTIISTYGVTPHEIVVALANAGLTQVTVTEIPQPPFPTGMDVNSPYPQEIIPKDYKAYTVRCGAKVWGMPSDIDSGIRHHQDICEECQRLEESEG